MISHFEDDELTIDLPALRNALDFFEIRPDSNVYGYFHEKNMPAPETLIPLTQHFDASFYLLYHLDGDDVLDFDTRVVPLVEHEIEVVG